MQRASARSTVQSKASGGPVNRQSGPSARAKPLDFLFIGAGADTTRDRRIWRASARDCQLRSKSLAIEDLAGQTSEQKLDALVAKARQMRQLGAIAKGTQVVLDFHGFVEAGELYLTNVEDGTADFTVKAEILVRKLREALADPTDPDTQESTQLFHLRCCFGGQLRQRLKIMPGGPTLIHAGNKACLSSAGSNAINQIIRKFKRGPRGDHPLTRAQQDQIWSTAIAQSGENIAWVERGKIQKHNALRSACEAAANKTIKPGRRGRVIAAKLDHGSMESLQKILGKNPRVTYEQSKFGENCPLDIAATSERQSALKVNYLVEVLGHDVNKPYDNGSTVLHNIARHGSSATLRNLIHHGGSALIADNFDFLPLHRSARSTCETRQKIEYLLNADWQGKVDRPGPEGRSPLQLAIEAGNVEAVTTLLHCGADPDFQDVDGNSAADLLPLVADATTRKALSVLLQQAQSPINRRNAKGFTSLHIKATHGSAVEVQAILQQQADPAMRDIYGSLPIHLLAAHSRTDTLAKLKLLSPGGVACLNATDLNGNTPLHYAALNGNEDAMTALLQLGADPGVPNQYGILPIHCARKNVVGPLMQAMKGRPDGIKTLPDLSLHMNRLVASGSGEDSLPALMKLPGALERRDSKGMTALAEAALKGNLKTARLLLEADASPNIRFDDGKTLLEQLRELQMEDMAQLLLEFNADPNW